MTEWGLDSSVLLVLVVEGYVSGQAGEGTDVPWDTFPKPGISNVKRWHESYKCIFVGTESWDDGRALRYGDCNRSLW